MRAHVLDENGVIINTILVEQLGENMIEATEGGIGDKFDGAAIVKRLIDDAEVPKVVTMRQARLALHKTGYLSSVVAAVEAAGDEAKIEWEFAQDVAREYGLVKNLAGALGLTDKQIDDLFIMAAGL